MEDAMNDMICCFFGHHDAPSEIKPILKDTISRLIIEEGISNYLVGNHGAFDGMVYTILKELRAKHPHICFNVVLAYMPQKREDYNFVDPMDTLYPEGLESIPKRFAISWRNDWMLKQSEVVICYVRHSMGGSGKYVEKANRQGKRIINLSDIA